MRLNLLWLLPVLLTLGACVPVNDPANPKNVVAEHLGEIAAIPYGNGVYYTKTTGADLGNLLSQLSAKYPGQAISITPVSTNQREIIIEGYFIHVALPAKCAKEVAETE